MFANPRPDVLMLVRVAVSTLKQACTSVGACPCVCKNGALLLVQVKAGGQRGVFRVLPVLRVLREQFDTRRADGL